MKVLVATSNPGKLAELAAALGPEGIEVVGLEALADRSLVPETGVTFEENARAKAEGYSARTELPVLADDSGLEVDALEGRPGVHSARFGGPDLSDAARCRVVLKGLVDVPDERRTARFRCVLVLARRGRTLSVHEGAVEGRILRELRGKEGFGYDPIFHHTPSGATFAEMPPERKRACSHRAVALASLVQGLRRGIPRLA